MIITKNTKPFPLTSENFSSAQCHKTLEIVQNILSNGDDKVVVVSQWAKMVDVLEKFLKKKKIDFVRLPDDPAPTAPITKRVREIYLKTSCLVLIAEFLFLGYHSIIKGWRRRLQFVLRQSSDCNRPDLECSARGASERINSSGRAE